MSDCVYPLPFIEGGAGGGGVKGPKLNFSFYFRGSNKKREKNDGLNRCFPLGKKDQFRFPDLKYYS